MKNDYEELLRLGEKDLVKTQSDLTHERERIEDLEGIIDFLKTSGEELRKNRDSWARSFRNLSVHTQSGELYQTLRNDRDYWMNRSTKLTVLANSAIEEIPDKLRAAREAVIPGKTPEDVEAFLEFCSDVIREFRRRIRGR